MTVVLSMIVRDEAETLQHSLSTLLPLIDSWVILDTGSTDDTPDVINETLKDIPGELHRVEWTNFGEARTMALALADGKADWALMVDAEWYADIHPGLRDWLADDPDPTVAAWLVEIAEANTRWRRPLLTRADRHWTYHGPVHEVLDTSERHLRELTGLTLHHRPSKSDPGKFERYIALLEPDAALGFPRATFYLAESYRYSGRIEEAIETYQKRAAMTEGYKEEAWYAAYQAAKLSEDIEALIEVWRSRPYRHEPLTAAARIAADLPNSDLLFLEAL